MAFFEINWAQTFATGLVTLVCALFGSLIMWKLVGPSVVDAGIGKKLGPAMLTFLKTPSIRTGRKVKTDDGREVPELVTPLQDLGREVAYYGRQKLSSILGIDEQSRQQVIADFQESIGDPNGPLAPLMAANPKMVEKALRSGDYAAALIELFVKPYAPQIRDMLVQKVKTRTSNVVPAATSTAAASPPVTSKPGDWWK